MAIDWQPLDQLYKAADGDTILIWCGGIIVRQFAAFLRELSEAERVRMRITWWAPFNFPEDYQ